ncbi:putative 54S ribosomal protein L3 [Seiridium unicorne]|uniref:Large ribosomal subunit protein mL44 n=1 Tax=Seiridium unicorne TaxID=138068 RepID=A0ABR2V852_9PEZI
MKRVRIASRLLASAPRAVRIPRSTHQLPLCSRRHASTIPEQNGVDPMSEINRQLSEDAFEELPAEKDPQRSMPLPSPPPQKARNSAKLAALHARLSLSPKIPVETLARALIDPSADAHPKYNNTNLAFIGSALLQHHASEYLITKFPRLPMAILFAAMKGYVGSPVLHQVARAWGVESAAAPGEEVDPGLLQFDIEKATFRMTRWGYVRAESAEIQRFKWRRGMSSRVMYDDAFGEMVPGQKSVSDNTGQFVIDNERNNKEMFIKDFPQNAHANFVRALVGAVYLHCGRETAKSFIKSHFLSRRLDLENLFEFKLPTRELARLCAREDFEPPVARLESETGRLSRTPVYVVGIYSGRDKLGEGTGSDLDSGRVAAAINALKAWYLYSPGEVGVPSDTLADDAEPWKPAYVDIGEIIS